MPPTLESTVYSSRDTLRPVVPTGGDPKSPVLSRYDRDVWQQFIHGKLIEWATNAEYFAEEDFEGPSREVASLALRFAQRFRDLNQPSPHRVVPDGDGGIVFEIKNDELSEKIHFWDDGEVEYMVFRAGKVDERQSLQLA